MNIKPNDIVKTSFSDETAIVLAIYGSVGNKQSQVCLRTAIDGKRYWSVSDLEVVL